jgi:WD40 repeat protein
MNSSAFFWRPFDEKAFGFFKLESMKSLVCSSAITPDRRFLALGMSDGDIAFMDLDQATLSGQVLPIVHSGAARIFRLAISSDGQYLLATDNTKDVHVYKFQLDVLEVMEVSPDSWEQMGVIKRVHKLSASSDVRWLAFTQDNKRALCSCRSSKSAFIWDLSNGKELKKLTFDEEAGGLVVMPNGRYLAVDTKSKLTFWSLPKLERLDETPYRGWMSSCTCIALSPDGRYVIVPSGMVLVLLDLQSGEIAGELEVSPSHDDLAEASVLSGAVDPVEAVTFLKDGKHIVSGQSMGGLKLWDVSQLIR